MSLKDTLIKYSKRTIKDEDLLTSPKEKFTKAAIELEASLRQEPSCHQEVQLQGMACLGTISEKEV